MTMGLTERQAELLAFIKTRIATNGVAPSYDEMAEHLQLRSRGNLHDLICALVERGALNRLPGKARALSVPSDQGLFLAPLPEVRRAMLDYANEHGISVETAALEALRAYFMGPWS